MIAKLILALIGVAAAVAAVVGIVKGTISIRSRRYARDEQPLAFWASICIYLAWSALMAYFVFKKGA